MKKTQKKPKGKVTSKERLHVLRDLFLNVMWPLLEAQGFVKEPFAHWLWGWEPGVHGYYYQTVRLRGSYIDYMRIFVPSKSRLMEISFQIIELSEEINSLQDIITNVELDVDIMASKKNDVLYPYFGSWGNHRWCWILFINGYKLKCYFTRRGFNRRVEQLKRSLIRNFSDLEPTVAMWMKLNKPNVLNVQEMKIEKTE